jgi:hypothetical protein
MLMFLTLLLSLSAAVAGPKMWDDEILSPAQIAEMRKALKPLAEARAYAQDSLPPCEAMDYISNAYFQHEPPAKLCPIAHGGYEKMQRYDRRVRDFCRDLSSWAQKNLTPEEAGRSPEQRKKVRQELRDKRTTILGDWDADVVLDPSLDTNSELGDDFGIKESDDIRCYEAIGVALQYRKDSLSFTQHHTSKIEIALDELASSGKADSYFHFLRYGDAP